MKKYKQLYICISLLIAICVMFNNTAVYAESKDEVNYDEVSEQIENDVERFHIPGMAVIVVNKDEILFSETYSNCESTDASFIIGSMSKSFTAFSIMQLVETERINLDAPISEYIDASRCVWQSASRKHYVYQLKNFSKKTYSAIIYFNPLSLCYADHFCFMPNTEKIGLCGLPVGQRS